MEWDIDKELAALEPESCPGTTITRISMDVPSMRSAGVLPTEEQLVRGSGYVWCLAVGYSYMPKIFFYGHTVHNVVERAKRSVRREHPKRGKKRVA